MAIFRDKKVILIWQLYILVKLKWGPTLNCIWDFKYKVGNFISRDSNLKFTTDFNQSFFAITNV